MSDPPSTGNCAATTDATSVRPPRLPRWTRQEILVLIEGKRVVESRGKGRAGLNLAAAGLIGPAGPVEPKWASVSTYCRRHGVDRGPVQCRKRWSNLAGDFKKIKEWESKAAAAAAAGNNKAESFWVMRNDLRRERRLPGFFDREVYDILDRVVMASTTMTEEEEVVAKEEEEAVFDSRRTAAEDGLFSDSGEGEEDTAGQPAAAATEVEVVRPISG